MDNFLKQLQGYPYWRKIKGVVSITENVHFQTVKSMFEALPDTQENFIVRGNLGRIAAVLVLSRWFSIVGNHPQMELFEKFLDKYPITPEIAQSRQHPIYNYCNRFSCWDAERLLEEQTEADGWEFGRNNKGEYRWYRYVNNRLKWLN